MVKKQPQIVKASAMSKRMLLMARRSSSRPKNAVKATRPNSGQEISASIITPHQPLRAAKAISTGARATPITAVALGPG